MGNKLSSSFMEEDSEDNCVKKDYHHNYLKVDECLNNVEEILKRIPYLAPHREKDLQKLIELQAKLTVKIVANRLGTGFISAVRKVEDSNTPHSICFCDLCRGCGKKVIGEITVRTAEHVLRGSPTDSVTCELYNDTDLRISLRLRAKQIINVNYTCDTANIIFPSCDERFLEELDKYNKDRVKLLQQLNDVFKMTWEEDDQIAIIVSYPHGGIKKVSIGRLYNKKEYDTATCSGSSGAHVLCLNNHEQALVHNGSLGVNKLNAGTFYFEGDDRCCDPYRNVIQYFLLCFE